MTELGLDGPWRASAAHGDLALRFADDEFDDGDWVPLDVPGHWRSTPELAAEDGPVLYRTRFTTPGRTNGDGTDSRWWLVFDGMFYESDIWLDGTYLGDTEGYFFPHAFEVTEQLDARGQHTLGVELACTPERDKTAKRNLTGVFQHWDCLDPEWNPGGIWRPVHLQRSGPVRIRFFRALCREATADAALVFCRAVLDTRASCTVDLVTRIGGHEVLESRTLAAGENRVEWVVGVPEPDLWWPRALGAQPLYDLDVSVRLGDGQTSDHRHRRIGLRSVRLDDWVLHVNGERMFVKGSNQGPSRMALGEATADELARDVDLAIDANLDMLRVHAHISRPELYEAADERGLMLWQDLPLQWGYGRGVRKQARRQAREAVDLLAHHPSVVLWCGHNEPMTLDIDAEAIADPARYARLALKGARQMALPTWNKTVLDHSIRRVLEKNDPSRPAIAHSGVWPHPPQLDGTDSHLYFGWYNGHERDFPVFLRRWPRMARFVSEFGAQAVPDDDAFMDPERWPDLDWHRLAHRHALQRSRFDVYAPPAEHETFASWREATQAYQSTVVKHHIEALRRIKYRPTGGFLHFCFADGHPAVTWSVLDASRRPKAAFEALRSACAPLIVVADRLGDHVHAGDGIRLDVHVVSDLRQPLEGAEVSARLHWAGGEIRRRWGGDIPADSCVLVGTFVGTVPADAGPLVLDLDLVAGDRAATNRYETVVVTGH